MSDMKPIETLYKGYRFRSRLEARWAVFFDTLGIKWEYEKEGYNLDGTWYLPDFWLPEHQYWIEIKGQHPTQEEKDKAILLAMSSNHPVYIFHGSIWQPGIDDTEEIEMYGVEMIKTARKGASCYSPEEANMQGQDTTSPCYKQKCSHGDMRDGNYYGCPYVHDIANRGEEGKLVRALYMAEIQFSPGDTCKLKLTAESKLQFLQPAYDKAPPDQSILTGYREIPIPQCIHDNYQSYVELFQRFSSNWIWNIGAVYAAIYSEDVYRWCECSYCGKLGITPDGNESYLPCHKEHKRAKKHYGPDEEADRTGRLIDAYTAARQARFEHGEKGR